MTSVADSTRSSAGTLADPGSLALLLWRLQFLLFGAYAVVSYVVPGRVMGLLAAAEVTSTEQVAVDMIRMTSIYPLATCLVSLVAAGFASTRARAGFAWAFVGSFGMVAAVWGWALASDRYGQGAIVLVASLAVFLVSNLALAFVPSKDDPTEAPVFNDPPPKAKTVWLVQAIYWGVVAVAFVLQPMLTIGRQTLDPETMVLLAQDQTRILGAWSLGFTVFSLAAGFWLRSTAWRGFAWLFTAFLVVYFPVFSSVALNGRYHTFALAFLVPTAGFLWANLRVARFYAP